MVVAFRTGPGRNEAVFGGEDERKLNVLWTSSAAQQAWIKDVAETARRLRNQSVVVGYDLMVEPETKNHSLWNGLAAKITQAIREVDARTPILVGGADWSTADSLDSLQPTGDSRTVYVVHQYEPYGYSHQERKGSSFETSDLEQVDRKIREFKLRHRVPLRSMNSGPCGPPDVDRFISEEMRRIEALGANHAIWLWETSFPLNYDEFNFRHGPDRNQHTDVPTSQMIEAIKRNWGLNRIHPDHPPPLLNPPTQDTGG